MSRVAGEAQCRQPDGTHQVVERGTKLVVTAAGKVVLLAFTEGGLTRSQGELRRIAPPIQERFDVVGPIQNEEGPKQLGPATGSPTK